MTTLFLAILNMSITASVVVLAVMLARILLKKAPKIFSYALWSVVLFRLVCPFGIESGFGLMPTLINQIPQDIIYFQNPAIPPVIPENDNSLDNANVSPGNSILANLENSISAIHPVFNIAGYIWLLGFVVLLLHATIGYIRLKRRIYYATLIRDNIFETDAIKTPFVLGFIRPKIYIPLGIDLTQQDYILKHEQTHIKRRDYLIKAFTFIVFALHWFNPFIWIAYFLMSKDMEMSCDEAVLQKAGKDIRGVYSSSLLNLSIKNVSLLSPLAFGESNVKSRVKNVISFRKPSRVMTLLAIIVVSVFCAGFSMNRVDGNTGRFGFVFTPKNKSTMTYYLENATEREKLERLLFLTLHSDSKAELGTVLISSYMMPKCNYSITNDELLIHAIIESEFDERFYGVKNNDVIARFEITNNGTTLIFRSAAVPLFADSGARYVYTPINGGDN